MVTVPVAIVTGLVAIESRAFWNTWPSSDHVTRDPRDRTWWLALVGAEALLSILLMGTSMDEHLGDDSLMDEYILLLTSLIFPTMIRASWFYLQTHITDVLINLKNSDSWYDNCWKFFAAFSSRIRIWYSSCNSLFLCSTQHSVAGPLGNW